MAPVETSCAGLQRPAAAGGVLEQEAQQFERAARHVGRLAPSLAHALDEGLADERFVHALHLRAQDQARIVAEVGHDHCRTERIDRGQGTSRGFHPDADRLHHLAGLREGPIPFVRWGVASHNQDVLGLNRGEASDEDGEVHRRAGERPDGPGEDRAGQPRLSVGDLVLRRHAADLPARDLVVPQPDRRFLAGVGAVELGRGGSAGEGRQRRRAAARLYEILRNVRCRCERPIVGHKPELAFLKFPQRRRFGC